MYVGADDHVLCPRNAAMRNVEGQMRNIEACLRRLGTDYLDIWRPQFNQGGGHADRDMAICVETFEKARPQGKVRWLGMSSHNREFISHVIDKFPAYSMVIFPYTAKSKAKPADIKSLDPKEVSESGVGLGLGDTRASIFEAVKRADVGVVTIKPFGGGSLFRTQIKFGATDTSEEDYERARLTLAYILCNGSITATVPGMTTVKEAENNVRASAERHALLDQRGIWKLCEATNEMWDNLPEGYRWLHEWEWV
jgi:aryl-alcohol dehydrogenase-like predicted oxidoreductase